MRHAIVRTALAACGGVVLCLVIQSLATGWRGARARQTGHEHKAAVSGWENEGGGLAPSHDPAR